MSHLAITSQERASIAMSKNSIRVFASCSSITPILILCRWSGDLVLQLVFKEFVTLRSPLKSLED